MQSLLCSEKQQNGWWLYGDKIQKIFRIPTWNGILCEIGKGVRMAIKGFPIEVQSLIKSVILQDSINIVRRVPDYEEIIFLCPSHKLNIRRGHS